MRIRTTAFATIAAIAAMLAFDAEAANVSVSISISPQTSPFATAPTITWSSTGAASCLASDGWTGAKPAAGSETLPQVTKTTKFTLTCSSPTGPVTLNWTSPTQNTDGSALTNIAGWQIMIGSSATSLSRGPVINTPAATSAAIEAPPGNQFFAVRTVRTDNIESLDSSVVTKNVVPDKAAGSVTLAVDVRPNPPTNLTAL